MKTKIFLKDKLQLRNNPFSTILWFMRAHYTGDRKMFKLYMLP